MTKSKTVILTVFAIAVLAVSTYVGVELYESHESDVLISKLETCNYELMKLDASKDKGKELELKRACMSANGYDLDPKIVNELCRETAYASIIALPESVKTLEFEIGVSVLNHPRYIRAKNDCLEDQVLNGIYWVKR